MKLRLRIGVLGAGSIWQVHRAALDRLADIDLRGFIEPDDNIVHELHKEFPNARRYDRVHDLIDSENIDCLLVMTPPVRHYDACRAALLRGIDVFVEKPITISPTGARHLIVLARRSGAVLASGHVTRFDPELRRIRAIIQRGELGALRHVRIRSGTTMAPAGWRTSWLDAGGGALLDIGVHALDAALLITGDGPIPRVERSQVSYRAQTRGVEYIAACTLDFGNGLTATFECAYESHDPTVSSASLEVYGTRGYLANRPLRSNVAIQSFTQFDPFVAQWRQFLRTRRFSATDPKRQSMALPGLRVAQLVDRIYEASAGVVHA